MADVESNIHVNIDTSGALASLKLLQRQISAFHTQMGKSGAAASAVSANQAQNLMNSINATGKFQASMKTVTSSTESFTNALERNKLTSREYFRYTGAATKTFGKLFKSEFETLNKVARERVKDIQTQYIKMGRGANGALQAIAVRPLTLDMKNLGTQTAIAAQRQQLLNQLLKQGSTNLLNFGKNTQWAGRQLMVGFTVPLALLGATASKTFMQLEEQAIRFKRVYGELFTTKEETDAMVNDIQRLAKEYTKYGVAVEETMKMAADAAAQGKMGADLLAQVAQATRLAVLGGVEQEDALRTTISVTNAFGVATEQLAGKIDFLNAVENQTVVSIEDLTIAMPKAGPVVRQLGGDVEDLAFFLTAMKEGGINASEGANALKSGLASLINPSEKASKMLAGLGVNINGIVEANAGDVKSTVIGFAQALDTLDPLNRARAIEQLFGKFQFSRLSTLFQNVIGEGTQAARVLQLANATTEELAILSERELGKIENTTTYKFKKSMEDLKVAIAPVGEQFLKALTPIVEFVGKVLDKFNNLGDSSKRFLTIFTVAIAGVGPVLLMTFGLIANGVANLIKLFANMKSMYNRTGSASVVLGEQTNYLTKEQLEASAVSASLDQVHQRLKQTFTSEATAVNVLANAYRRAIAAQAGFTGPIRGRGPQVSQAKMKYSDGTTKVPGSGNQDTVPSMLTPGEAVIPAGVAQDPRFKPIISAMVNKRLQGFNDGSGGVTQAGRSVKRVKPDTVFAHATDNTKVDLNSVPDEFKTKAQDLKARGFEKGTTYSGIGFDIPEKLHIDLTRNKANLAEYIEEIKKNRSVQTMTSKLMGPPSSMSASDAARVTDRIRTNLIKSLESIPKITLPDGTTQQQLIGDKNIYSRIGNLKSGILGGLSRDPRNTGAVASLFGPQGLTSFQKPKMVYNGTATPAELFKAIDASDSKSNTKASAKRLMDYHPGVQVKVSRDANGNIIAYERPEVSARTNELKKTMNNAVLVGNQFKGGRSDGSSGTIKVASVTGKRSQAALAALRSLQDQKAMGQQVTKYRAQLSEGKGFSNVGAKHLSGIHITEDGRKVYVKPMIDQKSAMAELRATRIAREVHGLETPKQELRLIQDPLTGKTMYALESAFNPKFDPDTIPKKFTKKQYFKQMVAAGLRGDKDLKMGNLGGSVLTDVGTAGVFNKASGAREYAASMPSLEEMARTNLSGVKGDAAARSPFWFGNATADIPKSMSAEQYEKMMRKEIEKSLKNLNRVIPKLQLGDAERPLYQAMVKRLEDGLKVDWKKIHTLHTSIAVKPDEVLQDNKTGEITKPKTKKLPAGVKSSAGSKDTRMTKEPAGKSIVQKPRIVGKTIIRGKADAPEARVSTTTAMIDGARGSIAEARSVGENIGTSLSQSAAAASRTALYGTGPIDADAKSFRRELQKRQAIEEKRQRSEAKTQAKINANKTAMYGTTGTVDPIMRARRKQAELEEKRSKLAAKVAYRQSIIDSRAAAEAKSKTLSGRLSALATKRADAKQRRIDAGKRPGMGMGGALGVASGVAMMGSMAPGSVGEVSQKLMMPLMGMAMIMPMLQNKFSALVVGVAAVAAAYAYQRIVFDKAQDAAMELTEAMGSGATAMKSLSTFAGKVSAGEIMDRRRKDAFSPFQIKTGKTTFGQSFLAGEQGQAMTKSIGQTVKSSGKDVAKGQVVNQLATAVATGALDAAQARSIVQSLAQEMGDYSFGIEVNGKLNQLLGPNGENLLKDPIGVRVKLLQDTREKMNLASDGTRKAAKFTGSDTGKSVGFTAAGAAIGGVGGAIAMGGLGALIGSLGGPAGTAIGAAIGSKIGLGIGAAAGVGLGAVAGNLFGRKDRNKRIGTASGANVAMQKIALQQQQEINDSVELEYQNKLAVAKASGDQAEAERLTNQYVKDRNTLLAENATLVSDIQTDFKNSDSSVRSALMTGADKAITKQYKGTALEDVVPLAQQQMKDSGISQEQQYTLKMQMASGQIDPMQMIEIFDTFGNDKKSIEKVVSIVGKFGGKFANDMMGIVGMFKDPKQATKFVADISTKTAPEAQKQLELFQRISQLGDAIPDISVALDYYNKNPEAATALQKTIDDINNQKGKIDLEIATTILGAEEMEVLRADQEYFNSLDPVQQKVYLQTLTTMVNMEGNNKDAIASWLKANPGKTEGDYYRASAFAVTEANKSESLAPGKVTAPGDGAKVQSSPLDDLVKKLRDVRMNQIKVTEGFSASRKALDNLFSGKKTIDVFSGIENDLRKVGGSQDLIELIVGMDPKEYEKRKNSLFLFDNKKNIIGLKNDAKNIQEALNSIAMGDFNSSMEEESKALSNQNIAFDKLARLGVPVANAYDLINDKTIAAAIANGTNEKTLKTLIERYKGLTAAQEKSAAVSAVKTDIAQFKKDRVQEERLRTRYNPEVVSAINSDENLRSIEQAMAAQEALVKKRINSGADKEVIRTAQESLNSLVNDFNERINQLRSTVGFMQDVFDQGFSNAMESFDTQEQALQIKFTIDTKASANIINEAQNEILAIQYKLDDKEAALRGIEDQEQKINDKYDERLEALDEIEKANASISNQQKGQLTLAEALTSGDIAAAAKAAQDIRAQQAADNILKQKDAIEQSRKYELSGVTALDKSTGTVRTRKQLEEEIKNLQNDIFKIEEDRLEPAQEFVRLSQIRLDKDIEGITVLGKTRDAWEAIKNQVDLALIKSAAFVDSMGLAISTQAKLIAGYGTQQGNLQGESKGGPAPVIPVAPVVPEIPLATGTGSLAALHATLAATVAKQAKPLTGAQIIAARKAEFGYISKGGMVPKYFAQGGFAKGTDTVPAMLTPGEFIMSKYAVDSYGVDNLKKINNGDATGGAVYNNTYTLTVNAKTDANPSEIAQAVMSTIKKVDDRRVRGLGINGR